jgi:hypothetical protein
MDHEGSVTYVRDGRRVWIFHGIDARFADGVFPTRAGGLAW